MFSGKHRDFFIKTSGRFEIPIGRFRKIRPYFLSDL